MNAPMQLPVVCLGAVDHGKSTLIGRLLYDAEQVRADRIEEIEQMVRHYARRFEFAYFLDAFEEEVREERTMDTVSVPFRSKRDYAIADVPGHDDLLRAMLTGSAQAKLGVLVVSVAEGMGAQTVRHLGLGRLLGLAQLVAAVNKMDAAGFAQEPFERMRAELEQLCAALGCEPAAVVPVSALCGDNVLRRSSAMPWYRGPTLVEALDAMQIAEPERPLRFVVQCEHMVAGERLVLGRVEAGDLQRGQVLRWEPGALEARVEAIRTFEGELGSAGKGQCVALAVARRLGRGMVGGPLGAALTVCTSARAEVVALEHDLAAGTELVLGCGAARVACTLAEVEGLIDLRTGRRDRPSANRVPAGEAARVRLSTGPVVLEPHEHVPELGRFVLSLGGEPVGLGVVLELLAPGGRSA
jgi:sulfate adenylyltransferase subunit 1 (EFTu-like GTPase family)